MTTRHVISTVHPAALLRGGRPISDTILADLAKANRVSQEGYRQEENFVICLPSNPSGLETAVRAALGWMDRWLQLRCPVAVDVETSSLNFFNCKLFSIALSGEDGMNTAVAFTLQDWKTLPWDAEASLALKLREVLACQWVPKVFHNAPFDFTVLTQKGFTIGGPIEDTMAYHHIVQPDIPHDLGWVGHTYLDVEAWKLNHAGEKQLFTRDPIELLVYNAKDALNTMKLRQPLLTEIAERGMSGELCAYQNAFARLAARMELTGLPVNMEKRKEMGEELLGKLTELREGLRRQLNWPDFNPMNKNHAVSALYDRRYCGLLPKAWTKKTQQPSTKYENLLDYMEHPFVKAFIEYVENHHVYATQYRNPGDGMEGGAYFRAMQADGRLHPHWGPTGQKGSRFSSVPNVQNQRKQDRAFFEAPPGRILVGADKDQLELRLAACFAGVRELVVEMGKPDGDPHRLAAVNVYGNAFLEKSKEEQKRLRDAVKTTVYASLYRAGVETVHKSIRKKKFLPAALRAALTLDAVSHIYHSYFGKYVEIPAWHDHNYHLAQTQGFVEIPPLGRRRYFPVQPPPYTETANWPVQTAGSDIVGMQMVQVQDELDHHFHGDASIILHGHDALYIECAEMHAEEVVKIVDGIFGHFQLEGPAGMVDLTAKATISKSLKFK